MTALVLPPLSADPARIRRSGLRWRRQSGATVQAREPVAVCYVRLSTRGGAPVPLEEEQNDLQVLLAPQQTCVFRRGASASEGGYRDLVESKEWRPGEYVADAEGGDGSAELAPLILAARRGFESGEARGGLLAGWHDRVRAFWPGPGGGRHGTVLSLGTCEQNAIFRGEDGAFLSWFSRVRGPAQIVAVSDERCVHSSAVLLQHLRRTPEEAMAITRTVFDWIGRRVHDCNPDSFPAFGPQGARSTLLGRWPGSQEISFVYHLLLEAVGASPILERSQVLTGTGVGELPPPDAVVLTLGSELAHHYRHKRTGWLIALHSFRFGPFIGPAVMDWLGREFEPVKRTVADMRRDLAALADEVRARTGATLVVQNLIASSISDRVANYAWLGDDFGQSIGVLGNEANLMLGDLTRDRAIAVIDSDALAAELGVDQVPDRFHASATLVEAQRAEVHRVLRELRVPGFC